MDVEDKLEDFFKDKSDEYIESSVNQSILIMMTIELVAVFGIYLFVDHLVSHFWADVWLVTACMYEVKIKHDLVLKQLKDKWLNRHGRRNSKESDKNTNIKEAEVVDSN